MWNSNTNGSTQPVETNQKTKVVCNSNDYDVTGLSGVQLAERVKQIARENSIGKFDIFDSNNKNISPQDIQNGSFEGDLSIIRFNVAAEVNI
ncbi:MAG TPA: hypothetical protein VHP32_06590 [Ignavibacteria bacterium]|nr:hypothetical protein [Ignavibacteria bacterium]